MRPRLSAAIRPLSALASTIERKSVEGAPHTSARGCCPGLPMRMVQRSTRSESRSRILSHSRRSAVVAGMVSPSRISGAMLHGRLPLGAGFSARSQALPAPSARGP